MQFFASCPPGVADLTAAEVRAAGATQTSEFKLGVQFEGSIESAYRACLWSRTASRILMPLATFTATNADELYAGVKQIDWPSHIGPKGTLAVEFAGSSPGLTHTHFGALKTKDAIVDRMRDHSGERPSIDVERPSVRVDVRLDRERITVSLDLSGESLHRRAYRARGVAAPLKENLAAAILMRSGWPTIAEQGGAFLDPMCGSATLLIEAALMVHDIAPGMLRSYFGFIGWAGHDEQMWERVLDEARERRAAKETLKLSMRGYDRDPQAVHAAIENIERAKLRGLVHVERRELQMLTNDLGAVGLLATNPPYGERIGDQDQLKVLYATLGEKLREHFAGWKAAVFTGNPPLAKSLGINAKRTHTLFNGKIECRLLRFEIDASQYMPDPKERAEERDAEIRARPGSQMFANRLRKNLKVARAWARKESVACYRIYDADMPEYAFAIDSYSDGGAERWAVVQEYAAPSTIDISAARMRRREALVFLPEVLDLPRDRIHLRERRQQKGATQYEKVSAEREFHVVGENGYQFYVNFQDYLDTGLFLDHRLTRRFVGELARGMRFLNLFAYTGTATVYAVVGGASASTTVDMSRTYTDWAKRNLALNGFVEPQHGFVQADVLTWLRDQAASNRRYDLMFIDPPTHSRSKRLEDDFDVQRDHANLLSLAAKLLSPGGTIIFSNNYTRFKLDPQIAEMFEVDDWSERTLPWDFRRSPRIHRCYRLKARKSLQGGAAAG
jgi:23S rRNA (guanine2445-N2)-methyltransferase / 23S rRNA (guanine2069-N7)-methyltransferase